MRPDSPIEGETLGSHGQLCIFRHVPLSHNLQNNRETKVVGPSSLPLVWPTFPVIVNTKVSSGPPVHHPNTGTSF